MSISEICNRDVVICFPDESIHEAAQLMRDQHVGDIIVVQDEEEGRIPVGILTDRDIVIELLAKEVDLNSVTIGDVMSCNLATVTEEDSILAAIEAMRDRGIRRIPVVNQQGVLEGVIAVDDILDLMVEQLTHVVRLISREMNHERKIRV